MIGIYPSVSSLSCQDKYEMVAAVKTERGWNWLDMATLAWTFCCAGAYYAEDSIELRNA